MTPSVQAELLLAVDPPTPYLIPVPFTPKLAGDLVTVSSTARGDFCHEGLMQPRFAICVFEDPNAQYEIAQIGAHETVTFSVRRESPESSRGLACSLVRLGGWSNSVVIVTVVVVVVAIVAIIVVVVAIVAIIVVVVAIVAIIVVVGTSVLGNGVHVTVCDVRRYGVVVDDDFVIPPVAEKVADGNPITAAGQDGPGGDEEDESDCDQE